MYHTHQKGTTVKPSERSAKITSPWAGVFVHLSAFFHRDGSGVRSSRLRPRRRYAAAALLPIVLALSLAVGVTRPFAAENVGPPSLHIDLGGVRSTRAFIEPLIAPNGSKTSWSLEIATGEKGPWTLLRSGTTDGVENGSGQATRMMYRHLTPGTPYYLRVVATNSSGTTVQTEIETKSRDVKIGNHFTTLPIGSPEVFASEEFRSEGLGKGDEHDPVDELDAPGYVECGSRVGSAECEAHVETNGAQTEYRFEYAPAEAGHAPPEGSASWQLFSSAGSGHVTVAEDFAEPKASVTGLTPETTYYVRFEAENEKDEKKPVVLTGSFTTVTAAPQVGGSADAENVTATSAYLTGSVIPDDSETHYYFQYTTEPGNPASWVEVPGSAGTVPAAEATEEYVFVGAQLTGFHPGTVSTPASSPKTCMEKKARSVLEETNRFANRFRAPASKSKASKPPARPPPSRSPSTPCAVKGRLAFRARSGPTMCPPTRNRR